MFYEGILLICVFIRLIVIINILLEVAVLTDEDRKDNAYPTPQDNNNIFFQYCPK